jgi:acylpyruvate hydrolase
MRLATLTGDGGNRLHVRGSSGYVDVAEATGDPGLASLSGLLAAGTPGWERVASIAGHAGRECAPGDLGPAVPDPPRILCLGVNYLEHALEGGRPAPTWPEAFVRGPGSVLAPYADLVRPSFTARFDYEGELGVVIGSGGRYLPAETALDAVAGYVILNDASAREWQRAGTQWTAGKNFDASMPIGPELVTRDELDPTNLQLTTTLNGTVMQSANTSQMIVDVAASIEFFSSFTTLRPGDVIATGTPGGVGFARTPPVWLTPGDVIEVAIEGLGSIRNRVVGEEGAPSNWRWRPALTAPASL